MTSRRLASFVIALSVVPAALAFPRLVRPGVLSARAQAPASTAVAVPTLTPTPASTPISGPSATPRPLSNELLLQESFGAMESVRQVHTAGLAADGTGSEVGKLQFSGDCDAGQRLLRLRVRLRGMDEKHRLRFRDIILAGHKLWSRVRTGQKGRWSKWKAGAGDVGYVLIFLTPVMCPIGSAAGDTAERPLGHLPVQNLGTVMVHDRAALHLRLSTEQPGEKIAQDWYVDQSTHYWDRFVVSDIKPRKRDSSITDMEYSQFNVPVRINPPKIRLDAGTKRVER